MQSSEPETVCWVWEIEIVRCAGTFGLREQRLEGGWGAGMGPTSSGHSVGLGFYDTGRMPLKAKTNSDL